MPRHLRALLSLLAVLALGSVVAACGSDDIDPASVAEAAETTRAEGSARIRYEITASGMGLPSKMRIGGEGVTALDSTEMDLTFHLGDVMAMFGELGDGQTRLVVDGGKLFVDPPSLGQALPGDKQWVRLDMSPVIQAAGVDPDALAAVMTVTPEASLGALEAAGGLKEVGQEDVGGVSTTHFRGEVRTSDYVDTLPADRRDAARRALDELYEKANIEDEPAPMDVWVDEEGRVRRIRQSSKIPAGQGAPAGESVVDMTYSEYGIDAAVEAPPAGDTFDATSVAADAAGRLAP